MNRFIRIRNLSVLVLSTAMLSGCVAYGGEIIAPYHPSHEPHHAHEARSYDIPQGHMPPPGECRIWFPDRPPGHQPPPGNCYDLERRVPPGAILVEG